MSDTYEAARLPAIIDDASKRLAEARTSAEVLEAMHAAQAALHYAKVVKAAHETQGDCLRMIVRAEVRMANEIDRGQANGELAPPHRPQKASEAPTLSDLGVRRDEVADWRKVRDAGEDVANDVINERLAAGKAPTKADIKRRIAVEAPAPRPPHVVQFSNLVRSLGIVLDDFADGAEAASLCARFDAFVDYGTAEEIIEFLGAFLRARNAGQAA